MKITMYELLGMVKDGKAPKKIKYKDKIYYYHKGYDFNYMYNSSSSSLMDNKKSLFVFSSYKLKDGRRYWDDNSAIDFLNDEAEILEEEKKEIKPLTKKDIEALGYACGQIQKCFTNGWDKSLKNKPFEEEKKIPKKIKIDNEDRIQALSTGKFVYKVNQPTKNIIYKINEIIDFLKSKGE